MTRTAEIKQERRRRKGGHLAGKRMRLALDESKLDTEKYEYRWVNTDPGRVEALTQQDDWEIVSDREGKIKTDATGAGAEVSVLVGEGQSGNAQRSILCRKLKKYQDEDRQAKYRRIDEQEAALKKAITPGGDGAQGDKFYASEKGIQITQGGREG